MRYKIFTTLLIFTIYLLPTQFVQAGSSDTDRPPAPLTFLTPTVNGPQNSIVDLPLSVENFTDVQYFNISIGFSDVNFIEAVDLIPGIDVTLINNHSLQVTFKGDSATLSDGTTLVVLRFQLLGVPGSSVNRSFSVNEPVEIGGVSTYQVISATGSFIVDADATSHVLSLANVNATKGQSVNVPLTVQNFDAIRSVVITIAWNAAQATLTDIIPPVGVSHYSLDYDDFPVPTPGTVQILFSYPSVQAIPDATELLTLVFSPIGNFGATIPVEMSSVSLLVSSSTIYDYVANNGSITINPLNVTGTVRYHNQQPVSGIDMIVSGGNSFDEEATEINGSYSLTFADPGNYMSVTPYNNFDPFPMGGIDMADAAAILDYVAKPEVSAWNPYQIISADVDRDQMVTEADAQMVEAMVLASTNFISPDRQWTFTLEHYEFPDPSYVFDYPQFGETLDVQSYPASVGYDFAAMKLGDVDANRDLNGGNRSIAASVSLTSRSSHDADGNVLVQLVADNTETLRSCQLTFSWNPEDYSFVKEKNLFGARFGTAGEGFVTMVWNGKAAGENNVLAAFFLQANKKGTRSEVRISDAVTPIKAFNTNYREMNVTALSMTEVEAEMEPVVYPNPVRASNATLSVWVDQGQEAPISMINARGEIVLTQVSELGKGFNNVTLKTSDLAAGVYICKVRLNNRIAVMKVVKE